MQLIKKKTKLPKILKLLKDLDESHQTIGNYYLIKNASKMEDIFLKK